MKSGGEEEQKEKAKRLFLLLFRSSSLPDFAIACRGLEIGPLPTA
jgi:hypothetical protein